MRGEKFSDRRTEESSSKRPTLNAELKTAEIRDQKTEIRAQRPEVRVHRLEQPSGRLVLVPILMLVLVLSPEWPKFSSLDVRQRFAHYS